MTATGGTAFTADTGEKLEAVYQDIGSSVGSTTEERDITATFVGDSLVVLFAAALFSSSGSAASPEQTGGPTTSCANVEDRASAIGAENGACEARSRLSRGMDARFEPGPDTPRRAGPDAGRSTVRVRAHHHFTGTPVLVGIDGAALSIDRAGEAPHRSNFTFPHRRMYALSALMLTDGAADGRTLGPQEQTQRYGNDVDAGYRLVNIADRGRTGPVDHLVVSIGAVQLVTLIAMVQAADPRADLAPARSYAPVDPAWRSVGST